AFSPVYLYAVLVIPLDDAVDLLIIAEHDDHGSLRLHLFLIIKILSVGLLGRRDFPLSTTPIAVSATVATPISALRPVTPFTAWSMARLIAVQRRANQLAIAKVLLGRTLGW